MAHNWPGSRVECSPIILLFGHPAALPNYTPPSPAKMSDLLPSFTSSRLSRAESSLSLSFTCLGAAESMPLHECVCTCVQCRGRSAPLCMGNVKDGSKVSLHHVRGPRKHHYWVEEMVSQKAHHLSMSTTLTQGANKQPNWLHSLAEKLATRTQRFHAMIDDMSCANAARRWRSSLGRACRQMPICFFPAAARRACRHGSYLHRRQS